MNFSVCILAPPSSANSNAALQFCQAVLRADHELRDVFFYYDAAYHGSLLMLADSEHCKILDEWKSLHHDHCVNLLICVSAALKRGILNDTEAIKIEQAHGNLSSEFVLSSLGELMGIVNSADRLVTFGG